MTATPEPIENIAGSLIRDWVQKAGLLGMVRDSRDLLDGRVKRWVNAGCPSPAPNAVKLRVVRHHVLAHQTPVFIETGTYMGAMSDFVARTGVECHTIEIDRAIYQRAAKVLARYSNVTLHLGDSVAVLPRLLEKLTRPATFWLDGHYSGSFTGRGAEDTPISLELDAILSHKVASHVVLIDDARLFDGSNGYPPMSEVLGYFEAHPTHRAEVSTDIIRIVPLSPARSIGPA